MSPETGLLVINTNRGVWLRVIETRCFVDSCGHPKTLRCRSGVGVKESDEDKKNVRYSNHADRDFDEFTINFENQW
jgi:hypothetical protein